MLLLWRMSVWLSTLLSYQKEACDFSHPFVLLSLSLGIYLKQDRWKSFQRQTGGSSAGVLKSRMFAPGHEGKLRQWEEQALGKRGFSFSQLWSGVFHVRKPLQFLHPFPSKVGEWLRSRRWRVLGHPEHSPVFLSSLSPLLPSFPLHRPLFLSFLCLFFSFPFPLLSSLPFFLSDFN